MNTSTSTPTSSTSNMKYHLLNLAAIASIVIAGGTAMQHLLPGQSSSSSLEPTTTMSHQQQQDEDCTNNNTTSSSSSSNSDSPVAAPSRNLRQDCENDATADAAATAPSRPQQQQQQEPLPFIKRGSIVELYSDTSYFAIPAIVLETSSSSSNNNEEEDEEHIITVENTITHETLPISSQFIHPYTPYPDNSRASCNIAMEDDDSTTTSIYMTPCAIKSHVVRENSGLVLYEVSYLDNEENLVEEYMPFMRVQRVHGRRSGSMLRATATAAAAM